jgi:hypothetical protein
MSESLGPANDDGVPDDEIAVAKLVQNAKARGLGWCKGALYRDVDGASLDFIDSDTVSCCAVGASYLESDTDHIDIRVSGNDKDEYPNWPEGEINGFGKEYMIGAGYRCAMQED